MWKTRCVLAMVALYVGCGQAWDIAVTRGDDSLEFYTNDNMTVYLSSESQNLTVMVYDEIHDRILYVDKQSGGDLICSFGISTNEGMCYTEENGRNIHGLAYDPATELLFFSDTNERSINWISLKSGSNNNIYGNLLIKTGDGIPTDLAVDSCSGYVYWINTNLTNPTIERAAFNGSERREMVTFSNFPPHSLVIDQLTKIMYYIEPQNSSLHNIWYTGLDFVSPIFLLESLSANTSDIGLPSSNSLTVSKSWLYWVTWCSDCHNSVWKLPKTTPNSTVSYASFSLGDNSVVGGIVAKYKIKENYQYIKDCEPLKNLVQSNSDESICVHGQSVCKCSPGYIGERCNDPV